MPYTLSDLLNEEPTGRRQLAPGTPVVVLEAPGTHDVPVEGTVLGASHRVIRGENVRSRYGASPTWRVRTTDGRILHGCTVAEVGLPPRPFERGDLVRITAPYPRRGWRCSRWLGLQGTVMNEPYNNEFMLFMPDRDNPACRRSVYWSVRGVELVTPADERDNPFGVTANVGDWVRVTSCPNTRSFEGYEGSLQSNSNPDTYRNIPYFYTVYVPEFGLLNCSQVEVVEAGAGFDRVPPQRGERVRVVDYADGYVRPGPRPSGVILWARSHEVAGDINYEISGDSGQYYYASTVERLEAPDASNIPSW